MAIPYIVGDSLEFNQAYWKSALSAKSINELKDKGREILDAIMLTQGRTLADEYLYGKVFLSSHTRDIRVTDSHLQPFLNALGIEITPIKDAWDNNYKSDGTQLRSLYIKGFSDKILNQKKPFEFSSQIKTILPTYSNGYSIIDDFLSTLTLDGDSYTYQESRIEIKDYSRFLPEREWDSGTFAYRASYFPKYMDNKTVFENILKNSIDNYSFPDVAESYTPAQLEATFFVNPLYNAVAKDVYTNDVTGEEYTVDINLIDLMSMPDAPASILSHLINDLELQSKLFNYVSNGDYSNNEISYRDYAFYSAEPRNTNLRPESDCLTYKNYSIQYLPEVDIVYTTRERIIYNDMIDHVTALDVVKEENSFDGDNWYEQHTIYNTVSYASYSLSELFMSYSELDEIKLISRGRIYIQNCMNYPLEFMIAVGDSNLTVDYTRNLLWAIINSFLNVIITIVVLLIPLREFAIQNAIIASGLRYWAANCEDCGFLPFLANMLAIGFDYIAIQSAMLYDSLHGPESHFAEDLQIAMAYAEIGNVIITAVLKEIDESDDSLTEYEETKIDIEQKLLVLYDEQTTLAIVSEINLELENIDRNMSQIEIQFQIEKLVNEKINKYEPNKFDYALSDRLFEGITSIADSAISIASFKQDIEFKMIDAEFANLEIIDFEEYDTEYNYDDMTTSYDPSQITLGNMEQVSMYGSLYDFNSSFKYNDFFRYT